MSLMPEDYFTHTEEDAARYEQERAREEWEIYDRPTEDEVN